MSHFFPSCQNFKDHSLMGYVICFCFLQIPKKSQHDDSYASSLTGTKAKVYFSLTIAAGGFDGIYILKLGFFRLGERVTSYMFEFLIELALHLCYTEDP